MAASDLTAENVRYRLNYDPETGKFVKKEEAPVAEEAPQVEAAPDVST